eukprot:TRINITY_DN1618_c1_g1_i1.p1 TRINITY_DN1618_c1_g1~~TRINITY_DN1618_c1_g1_i1.p1  ORF type:complete len:1822 (+),score=637.44 TRINITY_DN1618_c1_g1_i1:414-5468(+)
MTATADHVIDSVLTTLRATIDAASKQHEIKMERERKQRDRISAAIAAPESVRQDEFQTQASEPTSPTPVSGGRRGSVRSAGAAGGGAVGARGIQQDRRRSVGAAGGKRGSVASPRRASLAPDAGLAKTPPPEQRERPQKRMSLVQRQQLVQQNELPNGRQVPRPLPSPPLGATKRTVSIAEDPSERRASQEQDGSPQVLPPLKQSPPQEGSGQAQRRLTDRFAEEGEEDTHPAQAKRHSTIGVTSVARNGRKGCVTCLFFDGSKSYATTGLIPGFDRMTRCWEIEFWIKSGQRLAPMTVIWIEDKATSIATFRIALNTNERMEYAENQTLFFLRDNSSNTVAATSHEDICDGRWHHVAFSVRDSADNILGLRLDGKTCRLSIRTAEGPHNFSGWEQKGAIGAEVVGMGEGKLERQFSGGLADIKVWGIEPQTGDAALRVHWPLELSASEPNGMRDVLGSADGTLHSPDWRPDEFPETCLFFNGRHTHVNVGTLQDFGEHMSSFKVAMWMRSDQTEQTMALMKVTDSAHKHAQLGLELNRNVNHTYQKGATLLSVRDAFGNELTAQQSSHNLCDGQWHQLQWEVNCANNSMTFRVDCFNVDLDYGKREMPGNFFSLNCWMCLGAHNCRGAVQSHYRGFLRDVKIWAGRHAAQQYSIAHWPLDEGAGACLAMDQTGNGNNGVVYDRQSRRKCATWLYTNQPDALTDAMTGFAAPVAQVDVSYPNNKVEVGFVSVLCQQGAAGLHEEVLCDLLADSELSLERRPACAYGRAWETPWMEMGCVPDSVFRQCENYTDVLTFTQEAMTTSRHKGQRCSRVFLLRIGSGQLAVFDLLPFNRSTRSVWNDKEKEWVAPKVMITQEDKATTLLNKKAHAVEHAILGVGKSPSLFRRARTSFADVGFQDSLIGEMVQSCIFDTPGSSTLYWLHMQKPDCTEDEARCTAWLTESLAKTTCHQAAVVVQKSMRRCLAKKRLEAAATAKEEEMRRREHQLQMRREAPSMIAVRDRRIALVIAAGQLDNDRLRQPYSAPLRRDTEIADALAQQGWEVWQLAEAPDDSDAASEPARPESPSFRGSRHKAPLPQGRATNRAINDALDKLEVALREGACVLIHFMGYGASTSYYRWETRDELRRRMDAEEGDYRDAAGGEEKAAWAQLLKLAGMDKQDAKEAEDARKEEEREARRKSRKEEKKEPQGWVSSTRATSAVEKREQEEAQEAKKKERERRRTQKAEKHEFVPSPTPHLDELPEELPPRTDDVQFLLPVDCPLEYSEHNTISVEALVKRFLRTEVGRHAIVSGEVRAAPYAENGDFAFLGSSSGQMRFWQSGPAPDFFSIYLCKALSGSGVHGVSALLKSQQRQAQEAEMLQRWEEATESAQEAGRARPPCPVSKRGVSWDGLWDYVTSGMSKRGLKAEDMNTTDPTFVGDMLLADQRMETITNIPWRRRQKERFAGLELRLLLDKSRDPETGPELVEQTVERLQVLDASFERRPAVFAQRVVMTFSGDIALATPPRVTAGEWDSYLDKLFGGGLDAFQYRVAAEVGDRGSTFHCVITPSASPSATGKSFPEVMQVGITRITGRMGVDFAPNGHRPKGSKLPAPGPFLFKNVQRDVVVRAAGMRGAVLRLEKMFLQGKLHPILADLTGVTLDDLRMLKEGEFQRMEADFRAAQEAKRKEIERRKSELMARDRRLY